MSASAKILVAAALSLILYVALTLAGDLRAHVPAFLVAHVILVGLMLVAWRASRGASTGALKLAIGAAIVFRLVAAMAAPSLSDDVYRYVWDGRTQVAGHHPYKFAPADPMRAELRDREIYPKINHPEVPTIYPPLAEGFFAVLAALRLGVTGFKVALALLDAAVVLALVRLADALSAPRDRVILYAWNPLAVVEVAMSGHVEPLGLLFLVLAVTALLRERGMRASVALAAAIQSKLLPLILVPGFARRLKTRAILAGLAVIAVTTAPYALRGPWFGSGVIAFAHRWEHGAVLFALVRRFYTWLDLAPHLTAAIAEAQSRWGSGSVPWAALYESVWPQELARLTVAILAVGWAIAQSFRPRLDAAEESRLAIGGALLLAPTLHPWYVLWVLPLAVVHAAWGWILLAALVPLQYAAGAGEVPWGLRLAIVLPPLAWMIRDSLVRSRR